SRNRGTGLSICRELKQVGHKQHPDLLRAGAPVRLSEALGPFGPGLDCFIRNGSKLREQQTELLQREHYFTLRRAAFRLRRWAVSSVSWAELSGPAMSRATSSGSTL